MRVLYKIVTEVRREEERLVNHFIHVLFIYIINTQKKKIKKMYKKSKLMSMPRAH